MNKSLILPTLFLHDEYAIALADVCKEANIEHYLKYAYGIVRCNWSFKYDSYLKFEEKKIIEYTLTQYRNHNITPVLNFSKTDLIKEDLDDAFSNYLLDLCENYNCEVIVGSDILLDYIKSKYPDIVAISSVNIPKDIFQEYEENPEKELEFYNELSDKYDKVIIRPEFNKYLKSDFLPKNKNKIISILNNGCINNCKHFKECRDFNNLNYICIRNKQKQQNGIKESLKNISMLSNEQYNNIEELGINNFMIQSNKQGIMFLYPLFNAFILKVQDDYKKIEKNLATKYKELIIEGKYNSPGQDILIGLFIQSQHLLSTF